MLRITLPSTISRFSFVAPRSKGFGYFLPGRSFIVTGREPQGPHLLTRAVFARYSHSMVRLSVLYPATPGSTFDWNYFLAEHLVIARRLLGARGLVRIEVDRGIGAFPPGTPSHYHAIAHLYFESMLHLDTALAATAPDLIADQRKYYSGESVVQVSEVVPV